MNTSNQNSNNSNLWRDQQQTIASLVRPLRIGTLQTVEGWRIDISSLTPSDAITVLAQEDLLEDSTILCSSGNPQWVALLHGNVEVDDANAIRAEVSSRSPLCADKYLPRNCVSIDRSEVSSRSPLRVSPLCADSRLQSIIMRDTCDGVSVHVREYDDALVLGAHAISLYLADILGEPVSQPDLGLVAYLIEKTSHISIRPLETEVFSTFVDIGISSISPTSLSDTSIIYDIPSDSWHGE